VFRLNNLILVLLLIFVPLGCSKQQAEIQTQVERGKYLVALGGCNDCHTPKTAGPNGMPVFDSSKLLLSGHLEKSPVPSWSSEDSERKVVVAATNGANRQHQGSRTAAILPPHALVQHEGSDRGRLESQLGLFEESAADQKSSAISGSAAGFQSRGSSKMNHSVLWPARRE